MPRAERLEARPVEVVRKHAAYFEGDTYPIPWTLSPFFEPLLESSSLDEASRDLVRRFAADGYAIIDTGIDSAVLDRVVADLAGTYPPDATGRPDRILDAWTRSEAVKSLAVDPQVLVALRTLYRREPVPFQTLNFAIGTEQRSHSDTQHFQTSPPNWMCGVWIALEDIDEDNGPLHYYPGSQRLPVVDPSELRLVTKLAPDATGVYPHYDDYVSGMLALGPWEKRSVKVACGQALIWAANLMHGGDAIRDPSRTRLSQVTHYYFRGCSYYTPMASDVFLGNIAFRTTELVDLRTERTVEHFYKGQPFTPARSEAQVVPPAGGVPRSSQSSRSRYLPPVVVDALRGFRQRRARRR